ncbi:hypothetical protein [Lachnoclostridium sp. An131]|uniref:hypothetical protein n=1 Tax=Lachnoclostridium sp. An131 TaxID=1965555 RepID=UPI00117A00B7|nr:hypothetical protein [Lachnoclostridium sp. An131]
MGNRSYVAQIEDYLLELRETMPVCDQVHAWGFGALCFAKRLGIVSNEDYDRLLKEHNIRFGKDSWNEH